MALLMMSIMRMIRVVKFSQSRIALPVAQELWPLDTFHELRSLNEPIFLLFAEFLRVRVFVDYVHPIVILVLVNDWQLTWITLVVSVRTVHRRRVRRHIFPTHLRHHCSRVLVSIFKGFLHNRCFGSVVVRHLPDHLLPCWWVVIIVTHILFRSHVVRLEGHIAVITIMIFIHQIRPHRLRLTIKISRIQLQRSAGIRNRRFNNNRRGTRRRPFIRHSRVVYLLDRPTRLSIAFLTILQFYLDFSEIALLF